MILPGVLAGCSPLLGIEDPKPAGDAGTPDSPVDGAPIDGALIDAPAGDFLQISLGDFKLAKQQVVRFRVQRMLAGGGMADVTDDASYSADSSAVALGAKGTVSGVETGNATITVTLAGAASATVRATVSTFTCHPVINEFTTGTALGGGDDELIEIYNPCANAITVTDWTLNYRSANAIGATDTHLLVTLDGQLLPGALRVYGGSAYTGQAVARWMTGNGMQQNNGAIGLRSGPVDTGPIVDAVGYGTVTPGNPFLETKAMAGMANGMSASRLPYDGKDDDATDAVDGDNSIDFRVVATPTPGALNAP